MNSESRVDETQGGNDENLTIMTNILKRVGKGIVKLHLELPISLNAESLERVNNNIILGGFNRLYSY